MQRTRAWLLALPFFVLGCLLVSSRPLGEYLTVLCEPNLALRQGVFQNDPVAVERALRFGADVNVRGHYAGRTPLMVAAIHGRAAATHLLLERGANPNAVDQKGLTALALAKNGNHPEIVRLLVRAGARH